MDVDDVDKSVEPVDDIVEELVELTAALIVEEPTAEVTDVGRTVLDELEDKGDASDDGGDIVVDDDEDGAVYGVPITDVVNDEAVMAGTGLTEA